MLSIFRTNQIIYNILFIFYLIIIRFSYFFAGDHTHVYAVRGLWSSLPVDSWIPNGAFQFFIDIILLVFQAIMINNLVNNYRMTRDQSLFPGLMWVLINSLFPEFFIHTPVIMANLCLVLALTNMFSVYKKADAVKSIFNIGFWISVASLFYSGYIVFIIAGFLGMNILRAPKTREYLVLLIGACVPYLLVFTYYYWYDKSAIFLQHQFALPLGFSLTLLTESFSWIKLAIAFILLIMGLIVFTKINFKQSIQTAKYIQILYWVLLLSGLMIFIQTDPGLDHFLVFAVPLSIFIGMFINQMPINWAEFFHFILLANIFIWQFGPLSK
ncbi:MAG TPA: hypothetical protein VK590_10555 [Saprospiraceae bacterium]|nr:hypothetical protein [Saprospiraceae bacterium]